MTELIVVPKPAELARKAAEWLGHEVTQAIAERGSCALSLAGGRTPEPAYRELALESRIDWEKVEVFFGDERAVPPDHPESNYGIAWQFFLGQLPIDATHVHRMRGEAVDLEQAALEYEADLRRTLGDPLRLDLALLGVGPDGHVCSLFPGHPALEETTRLVIPIEDAPKPPPRRLTLTLPALTDTSVVVAAFGDAKAAAIEEAIHNRESRLPLALAIREARDVLFLLDKGAASRLTTND
jgi:6-phosphogluconolactonase